MKTFLRPALGAALVLVLAGCAASSGQPWTPPPAGTPVLDTAAPGTGVTASGAPASAAPASQAPGSAAPSSGAPASPAPATPAASPAPASAVPASPAASAAESPEASNAVEGRVIELKLTSNLQITDADGKPVKDIPVTPGETVTFKITNTAGFAHDFYIGPDQALSTNQVEGLTGIPAWSDSTPKEFTWTVPDDPTTVKFGCTLPGHYMLMNGTFSVASGGASAAPASAAPTSGAPASAVPASAAPASPEASNTVEGRVIELTLTSALQIQDASGQQIHDIPVTPGETVTFKITNTAGFDHNFYIGPDQALMSGQVDGLVGIPAWSDSTPKELTWTVPADPTTVKFGCVVPGHYMLMNGTFSIKQ